MYPFIGWVHIRYSYKTFDRQIHSFFVANYLPPESSLVNEPAHEGGMKTMDRVRYIGFYSRNPIGQCQSSIHILLSVNVNSADQFESYNCVSDRERNVSLELEKWRTAITTQCWNYQLSLKINISKIIYFSLVLLIYICINIIHDISKLAGPTRMVWLYLESPLT